LHAEEKEIKKDLLCVGNSMPLFLANDIYGKEINLEKFKNKIVMICIGHTVQLKEKEEIEKKKANDFYNEYFDKGLEIIRVASKKDIPFFISKSFVEERARKSCEELKKKWIVIIDWECLLKELFKMTDEPLVYVIDKKGIIRYKKKGNLVINNEFEKFIQELLIEN
jgi:peroxiredoxin